MGGTCRRTDTPMQKSLDPGSKAKGGDLGWASPALYVPEFSNAILRSFGKQGVVQAPFRTSFGWHIIRVDGVRKIVMTPYENAKEFIEQRLRSQQDNF